MSRDGRRVAFVTWIDGKNVVVEDGRPGEKYDAIAWPLALSDDGRVVAYAARLGDEQFCVAGGKRSLPYRSVSTPAVSADGQVVAFAASDGAAWFAVVNGVPGPRFDAVRSLTLRGRRAAYVAEERGRARVVVDGRRGPAFDRVTAPVLSAEHVGYGGRRNGRWFLVKDDLETPVQDEIASVFLGADHIGYVVEEAGQSRVTGPRGNGPLFDWVGWPALTADGRAVYLAARGRRKVLVTDTEEVELPEGVYWDLVLGAGRVGFGARVGRTLSWQVMPLKEGAQP